MPLSIVIITSLSLFFSFSLFLISIIKPTLVKSTKILSPPPTLTRPDPNLAGENMEVQSSSNNGGHSSFSSLRVYLNSLSATPSRLSRRAISVSTSSDEMSRVRAVSGEQMRRTLRWYDLIGLGIGGMVGAGVFVTTGRASRLDAGPSIVVSYAIAGLCALLSAFCYTEFAVHLPVAGGAFSYIRITFG